MKKRFAWLLVIIHCVALANAAFAYDAKRHYKDISNVLFGGAYQGADEKALVALKYATTIAIDQSGNDDAEQLKYLHTYGVPNLPNNVTDTIEMNPKGIHIAKSNKHRAYTHQGWTYSYSKTLSAANWLVRKNVLRETAKKVFRFDSVDNPQCDSFCAVLYYVHILGDLLEDSTYKENGQIISLVEAHPRRQYEPNTDIFIELEHYLPILFETQTNDPYYKQLMRKLKRLHNDAKVMAIEAGKSGGFTKGERMDEYHQCVKDLMSILAENMPNLLKRGLFVGIL